MRLQVLVLGLFLSAGCSGSSPSSNTAPTSDTGPGSSASGAPAVTHSSSGEAPVGTLLGKPVLRGDCLSPSSGIGSVDVGIHSLVLGVLAEEFRQTQALTLSQEEIDSFYKKMRESAQR